MLGVSFLSFDSRHTASAATDASIAGQTDKMASTFAKAPFFTLPIQIWSLNGHLDLGLLHHMA